MTAAEHQSPEGRQFALLAYLGIGASLAFCFWEAILVVVGPLVGLAAFGINPHLQAVLMWLFAAITVAALWLDRRRHGHLAPVAVGGAALAIIVGTLYGYYHALILMSGYLVLVVAVFLNQNRMLAHLNLTIGHQAEELAQLNSSLQRQVGEQVDEIERLARLKRFLPGEVAELLMSEGSQGLLASHRRYIACLFCDIRRFTAMTEAMEPEDVMEVLRDFHRRVGELVADYRGTIGYRAGDGIMVFFNDPIPCDDPDLRAVRLALDLQRAFAVLTAKWVKHAVDIGLGVGIASGYATMGVIGVETRFDYTAIGGAVNLAARLSDHAADGQVLISRRTYAEVAPHVVAAATGDVALKGISHPVETFALERLRSDTGASQE